MTALTLEPDGSKEFGPCECCGHNSRTVWGFVYRDGAAHAVYYVQWTLGGVETHGAHFDLILGVFGEGTVPGNRTAVSLEFRRTERGPEFMVIDASTRPVGTNALVGSAMTRDDVIGTPLAREAFDVVDAIWLHDARITEVTSGLTTGIWTPPSRETLVSSS